MPDKLPDSISELFSDLLKARYYEKQAKEGRIAAEEALIDAVHGTLTDVPDSGSRTYVLDNGSKVTLKYGLGYKADLEAISEVIYQTYGVSFRPVKTEYKEVLDEKGYEWYRENHPDVFEKISQHVEVKPKKIGVTIKEAPSGQ